MLGCDTGLGPASCFQHEVTLAISAVQVVLNQEASFLGGRIEQRRWLKGLVDPRKQVAIDEQLLANSAARLDKVQPKRARVTDT